MKVIGLLEKLSVHNLGWLSPEKADGPTMVRLAQRFIQSKHRFLVFDLHSTTLLPGKSPFVRDENDLKRFLKDIEYFLQYTTTNGYDCITLESAAEIIKNEEEVSAPIISVSSHTKYSSFATPSMIKGL